jgi:two-component system, cell cycle sensor histidine kinase PleC
MSDRHVGNLDNPLVAIRFAVGTLRTDLFPRTAEDSRVALQKLRMALAGTQAGSGAIPIYTALLAFLHAQWTPWIWTALWAVAVTAVWWLFFPKTPSASHSTDPAAARATIWRTVLRGAVFAIAFASHAPLFWSSGDQVNNFAIALVLLGACVTALMAAAFVAYASTVFLVFMGTLVALLASQGGAYATLTVLALVFSAFFVGMIAHLHGYCFRLISLQDHKDTLIEQLTASNRAKSDFLANMSHELRTPMNAILGFSEVIKDELMGPSNKPIYRGYAADSHASGAHLLGLINDILDLSKIEAGKFELKEKEFDLADIAEIAVRMVALKIAEKEIALNVAIPKGVILFGDPHSFKQVALNVASNAVKFTPKNGAIDVWLTQDAERLTIHTRDTGSGIRPEDLERVFESFGQGRHDVVQGEKGTGLGLPIVRGLMRAHGGDVTLSSVLGQGTEVRMTLPMTRVRALPKPLGAIEAAA